MAEFDYSIIANFKKDIVHAGRKGMKRGYHLFGDRDYTPIGEKAQGFKDRVASVQGPYVFDQFVPASGPDSHEDPAPAIDPNKVFGSPLHFAGTGHDFIYADYVDLTKPGFVFDFMEYKHPHVWDRKNAEYLNDTAQAGLNEDNTVQGKYPTTFEWDGHKYEVKSYYTPDDMRNELNLGRGDDGCVPFVSVKSDSAHDDGSLYAGPDGVYRRVVLGEGKFRYDKIASSLDDMAKKTSEFKVKEAARAERAAAIVHRRR